MWVIHDYTLIANIAYVKGRATITYEEQKMKMFLKCLAMYLYEHMMK